MALSGRQFLEQQLTELTRAVTLEHVGDVAALPRGADEPPLPTNAVMQAALRKGAATVGFSSTLLFSLSLSLACAVSPCRSCSPSLSAALAARFASSVGRGHQQGQKEPTERKRSSVTVPVPLFSITFTVPLPSPSPYALFQTESHSPFPRSPP